MARQFSKVSSVDCPLGHRCSRNCSGQSTLELFRTTAPNSLAATRSIENSYFHCKRPEFLSITHKLNSNHDAELDVG